MAARTESSHRRSARPCLAADRCVPPARTHRRRMRWAVDGASCSA